MRKVLRTGLNERRGAVQVHSKILLSESCVDKRNPMFKNIFLVPFKRISMEGIMLRPMVISELTVDPLTNSPIVILKEIDGERTLPIWIGLLEATAIASELEGIKFSRPMTHDLLRSMMESIDVRVNKVEVCDLRDNTYYALIHLTHNGKKISIDARPSDALALSLRVKAPIFVAEEVISKSKQIDLTAEAEDKSEQGKKWQEILEKLNPEDFGKYKM
jgi:bifunctional DNase/RNase